MKLITKELIAFFIQIKFIIKNRFILERVFRGYRFIIIKVLLIY